MTSKKTKEELKSMKKKKAEISTMMDCEEMLDEDGDKVMYFKCQDCDFKTKNRTKMLRHIDDRHLNPFQYICYACGKKFAEKKHLSEHERRIHLDKKVECDICGFRGFNTHLLKVNIINLEQKQNNIDKVESELCSY